MKPEKDIREWLRIAEMDLSTARFLFETRRPMPIEIICFHSQQAAEKMLKCFLVHHEIEPPKTHKLRVLCDICAEIEEKFNDFEKLLSVLNRYGIFPRYPNELEVEEHDAETAVKYADKIMEFVKGLMDNGQLTVDN